LRVKNGELAQGHSEAEGYWLFFDIKEGLQTAKYSAMLPDEQAWIRSKLQFAAVDPELYDVGGYGERVIRQVLAENKFLQDLRSMTRRVSWRLVFAGFLEELIWVLASTSRVVT
jgi:hypothetical protein